MKKAALPLLAMPGLLLLSYGLDAAIAAIKAFSSSTFRVLDAAWMHILVELVFAGAVLLLAWLVLAAREHRLLTGWLFLVLGLLAFFISTPFRLYLGTLWGGIHVPRTGWFYHFIINISFYGFLTRAGALIVVLGLVDLFRRQH